MSDLLSVGASGVRAYQVALTTTSENIANTGVEGYSRRITTLKELGGATSASVTGNAPTNGSGVLATGVSRVGDAFRQTAVRDAGSDLAKTSASATWLDRIQQGLSDNQLGDRLTAFFTAARTLASDPTSVPQRATLLEAAGAAAASFAATGQSLARAASDLSEGANQAAATLNNLVEGLARVNEGLTRARDG